MPVKQPEQKQQHFIRFPDLQAGYPPFNGEVIYEISSDRIAPLTIKTSGSDSYLVKLKKSGSGEDVLSVYVCGGESIDIDVPLGTFQLVYASGSVWYGPTHLFGEDTSYAKADELFEFYEEDGYVNGWTVSLYPVSNGNLDTTPIDPEEF